MPVLDRVDINDFLQWYSVVVYAKSFEVLQDIRQTD